MFDSRRDVDRVVEAFLELVPPNNVMLAYPPAYNKRARSFCIPNYIAEKSFILHQIDMKFVILRELPNLKSDSAIRYAWNYYRNFIFPTPVKNRIFVFYSLAKLPAKLERRQLVFLFMDIVQKFSHLVLDNQAVRLFWNQDISKPVNSFPVQLRVVHVKTAVQIFPVAPCQVVIKCSARRYNNIEH